MKRALHNRPEKSLCKTQTDRKRADTHIILYSLRNFKRKRGGNTMDYVKMILTILNSIKNKLSVK